MFRVLRFDVIVLFGIWVLFFGYSIGKKPLPKQSYPEHLIGAFTGGFGEQTCHSCHFDYDLNRSEGNLQVSGLPEQLISGKVYSIKIEVYREDLGKAGFQLASRDQLGKQAGVFKITENERVMLTENMPDSLQFIQHSSKGTEPVNNGINKWIILWEAPSYLPDTVYFNVASNAANGDASEFGDWIYTKEIAIGKFTE